MNYLVTGGAGFIGGKMVIKLLKEEHNVVVIDDLSLGKEEKIKRHIDKQNFKFYQKSICDNLGDIFKKYAFDAVFHFAALPRIQFSIKNPIKTHHTNINGTLNLLRTCRNNNVKRFIFSSSSSVYGDQPILPLTEDMKPNPMSPYALQKLTGEYYCNLFHSLYGLETISLRYFNVYGPEQDPEGDYACLIPKFIKMISTGKIPTINGDGEQTRDFTYVDDVINANIIGATTENKLAFGKEYNIGGGEQISVNQVTDKIKTLAKSNIKIKYGPAVIELKHTLANISRTQELLNWKPKIKFNDGLENTFNYFNKYK